MMKKNCQRKRNIKSDSILITVLMSVSLILMLYPILHTVAVSLSDAFEAEFENIYIWPRSFTLSNYVKLFCTDSAFFETRTFLSACKYTLLRTFLGTALSLMFNSILAFILTRKNFIFRKSMSLFWIIPFYLEIGYIPHLVLYNKLGLYGTFWVLVIPNMANVLYIMILRTYMQNIPDSYEEAAFMDGAGYMTIFFRIISPLCRPIYVAIAVFTAEYHWNEWLDCEIYGGPRTVSSYALKVFLYKYIPYGKKMHLPIERPSKAFLTAIIVFSMLPPMIICPIFQKYFNPVFDSLRIKD